MLIHNTIMVINILFKISFDDSPNYLFCNDTETTMLAFINCEHFSKLRRRITSWIEEPLGQSFKKFKKVKNFAAPRCHRLHVQNTILVAIRDVIYGKRKKRGSMYIGYVSYCIVCLLTVSHIQNHARLRHFFSKEQ